jgi:isopenicillin-N N-acyltransferase-like protein
LPDTPLPVLDLAGSAYDRGRQQATLAPDRAADVGVAVTLRLRELGRALAAPKVVEWLDLQHAYTRDHDPEGFVEVQGIAEGFGIAADALFASLYGNVIANLAGDAALSDACTAWAAPHGASGPIVVKNRDGRGPAASLACVTRHRDPEWGGRRVLCVGSFGAPGALAGGINTDGLAVVDTEVGTPDHGEGWLRALLMNRMLRDCATVAEAVALAFGVPHAGGGTLVMADAKGAVAAVELVHGAVTAEDPGDTGYVARSNHFTSERLAGRDLAPYGDAGARVSRARLATLDHALRALEAPYPLDTLRTIMARHGDSASAGLCRHDPGRGVHTFSGMIFECRAPALQISQGPPCEGRWLRVEP